MPPTCGRTWRASSSPIVPNGATNAGYVCNRDVNVRCSHIIVLINEIISYKSEKTTLDFLVLSVYAWYISNILGERSSACAVPIAVTWTTKYWNPVRIAADPRSDVDGNACNAGIDLPVMKESRKSHSW